MARTLWMASIALTVAAGCGGDVPVTVRVKVDAFTMPVKSTFTMACYQKVTLEDSIGTVKRLSLRMDGTYHTLEEVGKEFGVTRERIRQIEAKALEKIRQHDKARRLKSY